MMVRVVFAGDGWLRRLVTGGWLSRLGLGCTAAVMAMLVYGGAGAWAAAPEIPETKPASEITATTATLHGVLNPHSTGEPGTYQFVYGPSASGCEESGTTTGTALGQKEEVVSAGVTGLLPSTRYTFCLLARNEAGETTLGSPVTFTTTAAAPVISEQSVSHVGSTTATVSAQIGPGGEATTYQVEYGTSTGYGAATPPASLPASSGPVGVQVQLAALEPGVEYHFRFVARNALGAAPPAGDVAFTTTQSLGPSELVLPDNRAYEMVSPADGVDVYLPDTTNLVNFMGEQEHSGSYFPFRASADGDAVAYNGGAPPTGGNGLALPSGTGNQFMATRGPHGWTASDILPGLAGGAEELTQQEEYQAFSSDLSVAFEHSSQAGKALPLVAGASVCDGLYTRTSGDGAFHALFTTTPVPTPKGCGHELFAGASADNSHVLFEIPRALTAEAEPAEGEGRENLYESVGERLFSVNVLGGKPDPNATFGSEFGPSSGEPVARSDFSNVISADGSRVFWTDLNTGHVYVRENMATTVAMSAGDAQFWTATPDGRYAFYTEGEQLWRFDAEADTREALTPSGGEAEVQGVVGASADGSYVYFVAGGALAEGATPRVCKDYFVQDEEVEARFNEGLITEEEENQKKERLNEEEHEDRREGKAPARTGCTLYVRHRGQTKRITTLSPFDQSFPGSVISETPGYGDWRPNLGGRTAEVTPDGRNIVLESRLRLTGYDNVLHGTPAVEAFVYDADTGRLSCASCNPSGAAPVGALEGGEGLLSGSALGRTVSTYTLRWISEDGSRVFFDTVQPLVPQDTNGQVDVYEWEREGASSCPLRAPARINGGCVFLLSGGRGNNSHGAVFVDASASGNDVFFATRAKLLPQDQNENVKLYDARVDGGFPEPSLACTGTGCQGIPPAPPQFATPSSVTFTGAGNFLPAPVVKRASLTRAQKLARALRACGKDRVRKKRLSCEKRARKSDGPAKARKAGNDRGASR
jgi:hypothetical protein